MTGSVNHNYNCSSSNVPSMKEYIHFHGMLCSVGTANRCIQSFQDGGVALFADQSTYDDEHCDVASYDYNNNQNRHAMLTLNIWGYYLLVLFSLTGLCTLMGQTRVILAEEMPKDPLTVVTIQDTITSKKIRGLTVPSKAISYIQNRVMDPSHGNDSAQELDNRLVLVLKRRFEFDFGGYLSVMMLHLECARGRMHLVEVYKLQKDDSRFGLFAYYLLQPLHLLLNWLSTVVAAKNRKRKET